VSVSTHTHTRFSLRRRCRRLCRVSVWLWRVVCFAGMKLLPDMAWQFAGLVQGLLLQAINWLSGVMESKAADPTLVAAGKLPVVRACAAMLCCSAVLTSSQRRHFPVTL
jgi:hypothetical protein